MNFKLPKVKTLLSLAGVLFLAAGVLAGSLIIQSKQNIKEKAAASTVLSISPRTQNAFASKDITFSVTIDTGANNVTGIDSLLKFDPHILQVSYIERGSGIDIFDNVITNNFDNSNGTIGYTAFTLDKKLAVNGSSLEVLKVNAKINQNAIPGIYHLTFDPTSAISATNESQNALTDTSPGTITVLNPTPSPTISPTNPPGEPNSCGGTCGSNTNCQTNLYCYQGYCRNPSCGLSTDCNCASPTKSPIPVPTNKPAVYKTTTPTSLAQATTTPVVTSPTTVANGTIAPTATANNFWQTIFNNNTSPAPIASPTIEPINLPQSKSDSMLPWIIGSLVAVAVTLVIIAIGVLKHDGIHKPKPPVIKL